MSTPDYSLCITLSTMGRPRAFLDARTALRSLPDTDAERMADADLLRAWRRDPLGFLREHPVDDELLARLARAGALSGELIAIVYGLRVGA